MRSDFITKFNIRLNTDNLLQKRKTGIFPFRREAKGTDDDWKPFKRNGQDRKK